MNAERVIIIPCSGIGKSYGSVSREAAYIVTEELLPGQTEIVPLSLLVMGDERLRQQVAACPAVTIDGCKLACASKMVLECGGEPAAAVAVLDAFRRHREFKPQGIAKLNEGGQQLARTIAAEVVDIIQNLNKAGEKDA